MRLQPLAILAVMPGAIFFSARAVDGFVRCDVGRMLRMDVGALTMGSVATRAGPTPYACSGEANETGGQ